MSFFVKNNNIKITRGDSAQMKLTIRENSNRIYDYSNDLVEFTVKKTTKTSAVIFKKTITTPLIDIEPSDTENLSYGIYKYDVQVITPDGKVYTVIGPCDFEVSDEVNFNITYSNEESGGNA